MGESSPLERCFSSLGNSSRPRTTERLRPCSRCSRCRSRSDTTRRDSCCTASQARSGCTSIDADLVREASRPAVAAVERALARIDTSDARPFAAALLAAVAAAPSAAAPVVATLARGAGLSAASTGARVGARVHASAGAQAEPGAAHALAPRTGLSGAALHPTRAAVRRVEGGVDALRAAARHFAEAAAFAARASGEGGATIASHEAGDTGLAARVAERLR